MPFAQLDLRKRPRAYWVWCGIIVGLFVTACIVFSIGPIRNAVFRPHRNKDYAQWYKVGQKVLASQPLYEATADDEAFDFIYPPFSAVALYAPASAIGHVGSVLVVLGLTIAGWAISVVLSVYLCTGRYLHRELLLYLIPAVIAGPYVFDNFLNGQPNLLLLGLMLLSFFALHRGSRWLAGVLIGVAAAYKAFPILVLAYLMWRRQWAAGLWTVISLVVCLVLLPAPIRGFDRNLKELAHWFDGMILHPPADSIAQRPHRAYRLENQSLLASTHRLTRPVRAGKRDDGSWFYVNLVDLGPEGANWVFCAAAAALSLIFVLVLPASGQRSLATDGLEYAMLLILILLFTPKLSPYYFVWLHPALTAAVCFIHHAQPGSSRCRLAIAATGLSLALLACAITQLWNSKLQAYGMTTWGSIVLLLTLAWMLLVRRRDRALVTGS